MTDLDDTSIRHQLGGALLRKFMNATCGVARWQPASVREEAMIQLELKRILLALAAWQQQDPELFVL